MALLLHDDLPREQRFIMPRREVQSAVESYHVVDFEIDLLGGLLLHHVGDGFESGLLCLGIARRCRLIDGRIEIGEAMTTPSTFTGRGPPQDGSTLPTAVAETLIVGDNTLFFASFVRFERFLVEREALGVADGVDPHLLEHTG
jgi:hypothetical protein